MIMPNTHNKPIPNKRTILWYRERQKCYWCGLSTRMVDGDAWDSATIDHIVPKYKGGTRDECNLVSACRLCNSRRCHEDAKGLPEGSLLGRYRSRRKRGGGTYVSDERSPIHDHREGTLSKKIEEDNKVLFDKLRIMNEGERISFTITKPNYRQNMVIYPDKLTPDERQELDTIKTRLMDMAMDATEELTNTLKKDAR
jgi:hypothetical protein